MCNNIFQIYISESEAVPPYILLCMKNIEAHRGKYEYRWLNKNGIQNFMEKFYAGRVVAAYDTLKPFAYKADLARLCLLHHYGGWYFDCTVTLRASLPKMEDDVSMVVFKDAPNVGSPNSWDVSNSVIFSRRGSPVLELAIREIVKNVEGRFYGRFCLDPTGPGLFGRALAIHGNDSKITTGWFDQLTPSHEKKNYAFIMPNGEIFAFGKVTAGTPDASLANLGATGTNNYYEMYMSRDIYKD